MWIEAFAKFVVRAYVAVAIALFLYSWFDLPILAFFAAHRATQLLDRRFDLRPTAPNHAALHYACAVIYGLMMPAFYFLAVRTRGALGPWPLGSGTNTWWTIGVGVACMAWLAAHLLDSAAHMDRPRFDWGWIDRGFGAAAVGLCLRFHCRTVEAYINAPYPALTEPGGLYGINLFFPTSPAAFRGFMSLVFPQACFLGATLVYGFALRESFRAPARPTVRPRWGVAAAPAVVLVCLLFVPFWLSLPRVTPNQALALIRENQEAIVEAAREAGLNPSLLAGIIHVAQTRDHPRWTGAVLEEISGRLWDETSVGREFGASFLNASAGLCQMRPSTMIQTQTLVLQHMQSLQQMQSTAMPTMQNFLSAPTMQRVQSLQNRVFSPATLNRFKFSAGTLSSPSARSGGQGLLDLFARVLGPGDSHSPSDLRSLLLKPESNLAAAASMLFLLREQWRQAGFSLNDRPDILATLYNLGYERSMPHGNPRANDFGRRVAQFMQSEECRELFPAPVERRN